MCLTYSLSRLRTRTRDGPWEDLVKALGRPRGVHIVNTCMYVLCMYLDINIHRILVERFGQEKTLGIFHVKLITGGWPLDKT